MSFTFGNPESITEFEGRPPTEFSTPVSEQKDIPPSRDGVTSPVASSKRDAISRLDNLFNFQLVVFEVEGKLFQVLKNGFNVPGTIFEAMFTLPASKSDFDDHPEEGSTLENPICLAGIRAADFRAFLRILYPLFVVSVAEKLGVQINQSAQLSIGPSVPFTYQDWVGILKLSTMWFFQEIRLKAIAGLSPLILEKTASERISLGRTYRVSNWLRDEYLKLVNKPDLKLDELRDSSGISLDWETIAKILSIREQNHLLNLREEKNHNQCRSEGDSSCPMLQWGVMGDCRCNLSLVVDSVFQEEFKGMNELGHGSSPTLPSQASRLLQF